MKNGIKFAILALLSAAISSPAQTGIAPADPRAAQIMQGAVAAYGAMKTISGRFVVHQTVPGMPQIETSGAFKAEKPNRYTIDSNGSLEARFTSNGKLVLVLLRQFNAYSVGPCDDQMKNHTLTAVPPLTLFFNQHKLVAPSTPTRYVDRENWNGRPYDVVEQVLGPSSMLYFIGADHIVARMKVHAVMGQQVTDVDTSISDVQCNLPLREADFPVAPPQGAKAIPMPWGGVQTIQVGQVAPDFALPEPGGNTVKLAEVTKAHKAVLVTFWFYGCATCREEFPGLMQTYARLKGRGLEVVAIDSFDDRETVAKYVKEAGLTFPAVLDDDGVKRFGVANAYGVGVYPTAFLIDAAGKVVARFEGRQDSELQAALEKMGIR